MIYLDTSALIKRFVNEKGSPLVTSLVQQRNLSQQRKLPTPRYLLASLESSARAISPVLYMSWLGGNLKGIGRVTCHPLRGFDAVHLASGLTLKNALGEEVTFAAADGRLLRAAATENLEPLNVETARAQ